MAEEQKTKVYDVKVTAADALKELAALKLKSQELKDEQKALGKVTEENAEEYYKLDSQIKATNQQAQSYQKQITNSIKLQNQQEASLEKLRTQLALDNAEIVKYGKEVENAARKAELADRISTTTAELKKQEEALGDHRRSVGDYGKAIRDLKLELQETTNQLVVMAANGDTTSDSYKELIARAGELKGAQEQVNKELQNVSKGTEGVQALTGAVSLATAGYGIWTAASAVLGTENEKVEETLKKMMTVITALNSLTAISNTLSKQSATYRAAEIIVQKLGINQTKAETKALAAKNAMVTASSVGAKIAAAATWLWNAALAANPIVLIVGAVAGLTVGVIALSKAFGGNKDAVKSAEDAQKDYERQTIALDERLQEIENKNWARTEKAKIAQREELQRLKEAGASKEQLAQAEYESNKKVRDAQITGIEASSRTLTSQNEILRENIAEWSKLRETANAKDIAKFTEMIEEATKKLNENTWAISKNNASLKNLLLDQADEDLNNSKRRLDETFSRLEKQRAAELRFQQESLKAEGNYQSTKFTTQQSYAARLFKLQQDSERERLALQVKYGKMTQAEYKKEIAIMEQQAQAFYNSQVNELNNYYKTVRQTIAKQAGMTVDEQIGEAVTAYNEGMKQLAEVQAPIQIPGMSDEDFAKALKEYEAFLYSKAEMEARLTKKMNEDIAAIREADINTQLSKIEKAISDEYKDDLAKYTDNEAEKLKVQIASLEKQIAAKKAAGLSTYEDEAALRAAQAAQIGVIADRELLVAGQSAKKRHSIIKQALQDELKLYEGNSDKQAEINAQIAENDKELFDARVAAADQWFSAVSDMMSAMGSLFDALTERELQKLDEKYSLQQEALDASLANGLMTQKQYDKESVKLEKEKAKEEAKIKRQQAIQDRIMALFNIAMNTAMGIMNAVSSFWITGGMPWAAIIGALGAVQIAGVLAQPLPKAARGAYVKGRNHAMGGEDWNLENGETVVNAKSSSMFLPLLSAINEMGGGVPFTSQGSDGGYAMRSALRGGQGMTRGDLEAAIYEAFGEVEVIATIEDIRREDANYATIESRGSL